VSATTDPYFNQTTLLLNDNGTTASNNNTFLDSSTNNFAITRNGNTAQGTFTPFSAPVNQWSSTWDSTNLSTTVAAINPGTTALSLEFWLNWAGLISGATSGNTVFLWNAGSKSPYGQSASVTINGTNNTIGFGWAQSGNGGPTISVTSVPISIGVWYHFLWTRNGANAKLYVNGTLYASGTAANGWSATSTAMEGTQYFNEPATNFYYTGGFQGSWSNFRLITGQEIVSGNFTPSTTGLTASSIGHTGANVASSLTGTVQELFFNSSATWKDQSSNNRTPATYITNVSTSPFSPFAPTSVYTTNAVGGSAYFDGTGDYIVTSSNISAIGTNAYTLELWVYITSIPLFFRITGGSNNQLNITNANNTTGQLQYFDGTTYTIGTAAINSWNHVLISRTGGNIYTFLNGVLGQTAANTTSIPAQTFSVGAYTTGADPMTGYVSNVRLINGTGLYTATFTPPTTPPIAITNTSLLLNFTNSGIYDATAKNNVETISTAQVSSAQVKLGSTSLKFNGTSDSLKIPSNTLLAFGTGNFTIDFWIYFNVVNVAQVIFDFRPDATDSSLSPCLLLIQPGTINYYLSGASQITTSALSANTWYHVALVRSGANNIIYINGTQSGSTYTNSSSLLQSGIVVGYNRNNGGSSFQYLNGYIDDLRVTKGIARYTAAFTVPNTAFPIQ